MTKLGCYRWVVGLIWMGAFCLTGYGMYDPKEGRWLSLDPVGTVVGDETNAFGPTGQYADGGNLYEYVGGRPSSEKDMFGLEWKVIRQYKKTANAIGECGDTIDSLSKKILLDERYFRRWLVALDGKPLPPSSSQALKETRRFSVPNTFVVALGHMNTQAHYLYLGTWRKAIELLSQKGFYAPFYDYYVRPWPSSNISNISPTELYGIMGGGHGWGGKGGKFSLPWGNALKGVWLVSKNQGDNSDTIIPLDIPDHQLGILILKICNAAQANPPWSDTVSKNGFYWLGNGFEAAGFNWGILNVVKKAQ